MNGSMIYNGQKIVLTPGCHVLEKGLAATLECRIIGENAEYAVLRLKNSGTENTFQIQFFSTAVESFRKHRKGVTCRFVLVQGSTCQSKFLEHLIIQAYFQLGQS